MDPALKPTSTVYLPMAVDIIHHGHINIIRVARELGTLTVGLLTDQAIARYKRVPLSTFEERKRVIENIVGVDRVIAQDTDDYLPAIEALRPHFFVHGDDWKTGIQAEKRARVIATMAQWGGIVVEPPYTRGISTSQLIQHVTEEGIVPERRVSRLKRALSARECVRMLDAPLGLMVQAASPVALPTGERIREFDGYWLSHFSFSGLRGSNAIHNQDFSSYQAAVDSVLSTTIQPMLLELPPTTNPTINTEYSKSFERLGGSGVVISCAGENLSARLAPIRTAVHSDDFLILARSPLPLHEAAVTELISEIHQLKQAGVNGVLFTIPSAASEKDFQNLIQRIREISKTILCGAILTPSSTLSADSLEEAGAQFLLFEGHLIANLYHTSKITAERILRDTSPQDGGVASTYDQLLTRFLKST